MFLLCDQLWRRQLTNLSGEEWKRVRSLFTPIFTSGKMKTMLKFIRKVGESLGHEVAHKADQGQEFEVRDGVPDSRPV